MDRAEIKRQVLRLVEDAFPSNDISEISETDLFRDHLGLDSFGLMKLVVTLSKKFSIPINPGDIERMKNLETIILVVTEKLDQKHK